LGEAAVSSREVVVFVHLLKLKSTKISQYELIVPSYNYRRRPIDAKVIPSVRRYQASAQIDESGRT